MSLGRTFTAAWRDNNPALVQLLGLCPLLAVSTSVANAVGLALASTLVLVGSSTTIAALKRFIPDYARLPCFVLVIASFTTIAMLVMQAFAFQLYQAIALFVQIIVTNCMILARAEAFARHSSPGAALADALGTAWGFALALICLGAVRELAATGALLAGMERLLGPGAAGWRLELIPESFSITLAALPPGAFITAGLLLALGRALSGRRQPAPDTSQSQP